MVHVAAEGEGFRLTLIHCDCRQADNECPVSYGYIRTHLPFIESTKYKIIIICNLYLAIIIRNSFCDRNIGISVLMNTSGNRSISNPTPHKRIRCANYHQNTISKVT